MRRTMIIFLLGVCFFFMSLTPLFSAGQQGMEDQAANLKKLGFHMTGDKIVDEKTTLKVAAQRIPLHKADNFNDYTSTQRQEERTNVHIEWEEIPDTAWQQKINIMLASADLPDMIFCPPGQSVIKAGSEGLFIPLQDLVDQYASLIKRAYETYPGIKTSQTAPDGNLYALAGGGIWQFQQQGMPIPHYLINLKWLDKLGLDMPATLDEYYNVLVAFRDQDPNGNGKKDEIPFSFLGSQPQDTAHYGYGFFGIFGIGFARDGLDVFNEEVVYALATENYKQGVQWLHKMFSEGLVDQEAFMQTMNQYRAKGKEDPERYGSALAFSGFNLFGADRVEQDYAALTIPEGPFGKAVIKARSTGAHLNQVSIASAAIYPEIAMRWLDVYAQGEYFADMYLNNLDFGGYFHENGRFGIEPYEGLSGGAQRHAFSIGRVGPNLTFKGVNLERIPNRHVKVVDRNLETLKKYRDPEYLGSTILPEQLDTERNDLLTNLQLYTEQKLAEWVMEGGVEEEWDAYLEELKKLKVDRYVEIAKNTLPVFTQ